MHQHLLIHSFIQLIITSSLIQSIIYSFGSSTISSIIISLIHSFIYSFGPTVIPSIPNSFIYQFTFSVTQHFTQIHSFNHPLLSLAHSLISPFPVTCFPYRCIQLRRRLDVLLTFYLDKGSCTELAEVGLEALQYPGRV